MRVSGQFCHFLRKIFCLFISLSALPSKEKKSAALVVFFHNDMANHHGCKLIVMLEHVCDDDDVAFRNYNDCVDV